MKSKVLHISLSVAIALVWFINGFFCKLLNFVPRHQLIVSKILGENYSFLFTKTIGVLEVLMAAWILSGIRPSLCAYTQIIMIAAMNTIEIIVVPDLLLYGKANMFPALFLITIIFINDSVIKRQIKLQNNLN